jgi:hypothetical protein
MNRQAGFVLLAQWLIVRRYPKLDGLVQIGEGIKFFTLHFSAKHLRGHVKNWPSFLRAALSDPSGFICRLALCVKGQGMNSSGVSVTLDFHSQLCTRIAKVP